MEIKQGTIIDTTLIATQLNLYEGEARVRRRRQNERKEKDPEMHQACKGKQR